MVNQPQRSLFGVFLQVAVLWTIATIGYYAVLPALGFGPSYNSAPIAIAVYFLFWAIVSVINFREILNKWLVADSRIWVYGVQSIALASIIWGLLYVFSLLPSLDGPTLVPFTDILLATPWYFLPKACEILVQQILITVIILELSHRFRSFKKVVAGYLVTFGGAHVVLFVFNGAPTPYAAMMTMGAGLSALIFPYLILRVKGGFVIAYAIHLTFYILLAILLHAWPPPDYAV